MPPSLSVSLSPSKLTVTSVRSFPFASLAAMTMEGCAVSTSPSHLVQSLLMNAGQLDCAQVTRFFRASRSLPADFCTCALSYALPQAALSASAGEATSSTEAAKATEGAKARHGASWTSLRV